jgi:hypothetical protein
VAVPRGIALRLLASNEPLRCVWSGQLLKPDALDIDHCFPWAAWPCSDLWNLLPADRKINQHGKRDRLPSEALLAAAATPIRDWWQAAYLTGEVLPRRFVLEAAASLPGLGGIPIPDIRPDCESAPKWDPTSDGPQHVDVLEGIRSGWSPGRRRSGPRQSAGFVKRFSALVGFPPGSQVGADSQWRTLTSSIVRSSGLSRRKVQCVPNGLSADCDN